MWHSHNGRAQCGYTLWNYPLTLVTLSVSKLKRKVYAQENFQWQRQQTRSKGVMLVAYVYLHYVTIVTNFTFTRRNDK